MSQPTPRGINEFAARKRDPKDVAPTTPAAFTIMGDTWEEKNTPLI